MSADSRASLAFRSPRVLNFYATAIPDAVRLDPSNPKWIQLCTAGSYVYKGERCEVTPAKLDQMAANLRAHPAFKADGRALMGRDAAALAALVPAQYGVIALNFDHQPPPRPGQGWFLDVERRGEEMWGLCYFGPRAYEGMLSGEYKWTSIEWTSDTTLPTGAKVGAYLSGVALTNDPFIQGMQPIQLAAPGGAIAFAWSVATDLLVELRRLFALPETAEVGAVIGELAKLRAWAVGGAAGPVGVDVAALVCRLRDLLNLPTLSDSATIFGELDNLLGRLADEQQQEIETMPTETLAAAKPSELHRIVYERLVKADAGLRPDDEPRLVIAITRTFDRADDVLMAVGNLQQMMGAKTPEEMSGKLTELMSLAAQSNELKAQMAKILPDVEAANASEEQAEGEMTKADVAAVMSRPWFAGLPEVQAAATREALMLQRCGDDRECGRYKRNAEGAFVFGRDGQRERNTLAERKALRATWRKDFLAKHQISLEAPAANAQQIPNYFAGPGAMFGGGAQGHAPSGYSFANGQGQANAGAPTVVGGWTWQRLATVRPGIFFGRQLSPDPVNLVITELARAECGDKPPTRAQFDALYARVPAILTSMGPRPFNFTAAA